MMRASSAIPVARHGERGFALLIVFLMAAAVAVMLYRQIPRVAFESQRNKEELLIEHGEQYKRAIQLYFVAFKKYPSKIEDLENTNDKRFLRRRYIDPMTGKDEWRLIHVNAAGALTDSLVQKPPVPGATGPSGASGATGASGALGATTVTGFTPPLGASPTTGPSGATGASGPSGASGPPEVNAAVLRRPSDRPLVPGSVPGSAPGANPANVDPNDPRYWPPITLLPSGPSGASGVPGQPANPAQGINPQIPGQPPFGQQNPGQPIPGQPFPGQPIPGQSFPGQPNPGQPQAGGYFNGNQQSPTQPFPPQQFPPQSVPPQQFTPPANQPAPAPNQAGTAPGAPNAALNMINTMLTTPRQTPPPVPDPSTNNSGNAGGLAGVASTFKGPSIKVYKDHQKYQEWEFIFDLKQGLPGQPPVPNNPAQANAAGVNTPGGVSNPRTNPAQPNPAQGTGTGNTFSMPLSPSPAPSSPPTQQ